MQFFVALAAAVGAMNPFTRLVKDYRALSVRATPRHIMRPLSDDGRRQCAAILKSIENSTRNGVFVVDAKTIKQSRLLRVEPAFEEVDVLQKKMEQHFKALRTGRQRIMNMTDPHEQSCAAAESERRFCFDDVCFLPESSRRHRDFTLVGTNRPWEGDNVIVLEDKKMHASGWPEAAVHWQVLFVQTKDEAVWHGHVVCAIAV